MTALLSAVVASPRRVQPHTRRPGRPLRPATEILAPWNKNTFQRDFFLSVVEDKTFEVSFRYLGREKLTAAGQENDVEHCRMVGDEERDV